MWRKVGLKLALTAGLVTGGTLYAGGCYQDLLVSVNPCGTVFAFCTPGDWLRAIDPVIEYPDYELDPSCTMPFRCGDYPGAISNAPDPL